MIMKMEKGWDLMHWWIPLTLHDSADAYVTRQENNHYDYHNVAMTKLENDSYVYHNVAMVRQKKRSLCLT